VGRVVMKSPRIAKQQVAPAPPLTAWIVTFLVLYIRFMVMPLNARTVLLQVFIIVILLVLPSDPEYFKRKFVMSRIAILLILAFGTELE
jgi:hypothetical protein